LPADLDPTLVAASPSVLQGQPRKRPRHVDVEARAVRPGFPRRGERGGALRDHALLDVARVVLVDESQRLSTSRLRELLRRGSSLALATHRSHARELRRAGITVRNVRLAGLAPPPLGRYVAVRMEWARRGAGPLPQVPDDLLAALWRTHGGDVRAIEDTLYEWLQDRTELAGGSPSRRP
jgi:hypothetical protein